MRPQWIIQRASVARILNITPAQVDALRDRCLLVSRRMPAFTRGYDREVVVGIENHPLVMHMRWENQQKCRNADVCADEAALMLRISKAQMMTLRKNGILPEKVKGANFCVFDREDVRRAASNPIAKRMRRGKRFNPRAHVKPAGKPCQLHYPLPTRAQRVAKILREVARSRQK